jgi:hypothetical protein
MVKHAWNNADAHNNSRNMYNPWERKEIPTQVEI